jgi:twitching motility two-component system response regulator PilG
MKTILIVEDDANLCELVKLRLEEHGFNVIDVPDGMQMFKKMRKVKPDLIILDVMLPKMDGYKLCGLLKNYDPYRDIPIIIFTALSGLESKKTAKEMGAEAYIAKPFDAKILINKINELLRDHDAQSVKNNP